MKKTSTITILCMGLLAVILTGAKVGEKDKFNGSRTFEFDPDKTGCPVAYWKNGIGEGDTNCNTRFGLRLEKNCPLETNASAGAVLNGVKGTVLNPGPSLGYDIKVGSPCGAGAPRYNVQQADGTFHFVGGCANGTQVALGNGWTRVTFDPYSPAQAFPPLTAGVPVSSITLIVDEPGQYTLDNLQVNSLYADKPGAAGALPVCP